MKISGTVKEVLNVLVNMDKNINVEVIINDNSTNIDSSSSMNCGVMNMTQGNIDTIRDKCLPSLRRTYHEYNGKIIDIICKHKNRIPDDVYDIKKAIDGDISTITDIVMDLVVPEFEDNDLLPRLHWNSVLDGCSNAHLHIQKCLMDYMECDKLDCNVKDSLELSHIFTDLYNHLKNICNNHMKIMDDYE